MFTYEMTIVNEDDCKKSVFVDGNTYLEAVKNMHKEYGNDWSIYDYKIVNANY